MNGRIGVLLKNLGNLYREQQHVLVVQSHFHPEPPRNFPLVSPPASGITDHFNGFMVSTMVVRPLDPGCTQPSADLQARLSRFCEQRLSGTGDGPGKLVRRDAERAAFLSIRSPVVPLASSCFSQDETGNARAPEMSDFVDDLVADRY
jgi:hypothetical protein